MLTHLFILVTVIGVILAVVLGLVDAFISRGDR